MNLPPLMLGEDNNFGTILVPRAHDPSGLWLGSRALARPDFLSMRRVFVSHSQRIRFARFDGKSVNRGLSVLDQTRALDPNHRSEGSWALGTRMLTTPIFDFHLVISSLTTPTPKFLISCTAVLPNIHVDDFTLFSCCKHRLSSDVHNSLGPFYASNLPFCHFIINWARISGYK